MSHVHLRNSSPQSHHRCSTIFGRDTDACPHLHESESAFGFTSPELIAPTARIGAVRSTELRTYAW